MAGALSSGLWQFLGSFWGPQVSPLGTIYRAFLTGHRFGRLFLPLGTIFSMFVHGAHVLLRFRLFTDFGANREGFRKLSQPALGLGSVGTIV